MVLLISGTSVKCTHQKCFKSSLIDFFPQEGKGCKVRSSNSPIKALIDAATHIFQGSDIFQQLRLS